MDTLRIEIIVEIHGLATNVEKTLTIGIPCFSVKPNDGGPSC